MEEYKYSQKKAIHNFGASTVMLVIAVAFLTLYYFKTSSYELPMVYRISFLLVILVLLGAVITFLHFWRKHIVEPISKIIANTRIDSKTPLNHTGEEYLDGLVDHINLILSKISDRDSELFESQIMVKEAEVEKERTLISLLKKQINAHFTVNTLNVVRALINKNDKEQAIIICDNLSSLLRYANAADEYISLSEEFMILSQYVAIMQIRYPNMITFEVEEDDDYSEIQVPRMLIQPIIENSIIHGLLLKPGVITVRARVSDKIEIDVVDNGVGMSKEKEEAVSDSLMYADSFDESDLNHIALVNIQRRINMICGPKYGLSIHSSEGLGTIVTVELPLR